MVKERRMQREKAGWFKLHSNASQNSLHHGYGEFETDRDVRKLDKLVTPKPNAHERTRTARYLTSSPMKP